jgi:16S rRNA processing protein RimM
VSADPSATVTLARIVRPWGRRGEVAAEILTDFPARLTKLREVFLTRDGAPARTVAVRSCRIHLGQAVFHFAGCDSISDAERLRGLEVQVPGGRVELEPGRHYVSDLAGCEVRDAESGEVLGTVREVQDARGPMLGGATPESWVLVVTSQDGELLIPLAAEICTSIDVTARRIEVRLPEGLRDLNRDSA